MAEIVDTHFVEVDGAHVAFQVVGTAEQDLVIATGTRSHVDVRWEYPPYARFLRELAGFSRLILFDRRGTGASDPPNESITWEDWVDDLVAVLDAVGSKRTAVLAMNESGAMGLMFAALHPARVSHLVLYSAWARLVEAHDYPPGAPRARVEEMMAAETERWGRVAIAEPLSAEELRFARWQAKYERLSASPTVFRSRMSMLLDVDARPVLDSVRAPVLLLDRPEARNLHRRHMRYLSERLKASTWVDVPGKRPSIYFDPDPVLEAIRRFIAGQSTVGATDRILATVLFTDIVNSTDVASRMGDSGWKEVLREHNTLSADLVGSYGGRIVKLTGDGILATFDGPARGVRAALAIAEASSEMDITIRAGLHTGEVEVSGDDLMGLGVHIAARIAAQAAGDVVLVSRTVVDLVAGSGIAFNLATTTQLKGVPGTWDLFTATGP